MPVHTRPDEGGSLFDQEAAAASYVGVSLRGRLLVQLGPAQSGSFDRSTQQREQAAPCCRTEEVSNGDQKRERRSGAEPEKGHRDDPEIL